MTTKELLEKYYDIEMNNVFCYSATYLMDSPKKGYEREWREACESAGITPTAGHCLTGWARV